MQRSVSSRSSTTFKKSARHTIKRFSRSSRQRLRRTRTNSTLQKLRLKISLPVFLLSRMKIRKKQKHTTKKSSKELKASRATSRRNLIPWRPNLKTSSLWQPIAEVKSSNRSSRKPPRVLHQSRRAHRSLNKSSELYLLPHFQQHRSRIKVTVLEHLLESLSSEQKDLHLLVNNNVELNWYLSMQTWKSYEH